MWISAIGEFKDKKTYWVRSNHSSIIGRAKYRDNEFTSRSVRPDQVWVHATDAHPSTIIALDKLEGTLSSLNEHEQAEYVYFMARWARELKHKGLDATLLNESSFGLRNENFVRDEIASLLDVVDSSVFTGDAFIQAYGKKANRDYLASMIKNSLNQIIKSKKGA
ncbi:hypothetical protein LMH73_003705 [Vibrio splendidus]|nr:hypothetical protein [Vibrio splendidus]MCC4882971.1 hypothetical protein [Vibrio splendidus]